LYTIIQEAETFWRTFESEKFCQEKLDDKTCKFRDDIFQKCVEQLTAEEAGRQERERVAHSNAQKLLQELEREHAGFFYLHVLGLFCLSTRSLLTLVPALRPQDRRLRQTANKKKRNKKNYVLGLVCLYTRSLLTLAAHRIGG